MLSDDLDYSQNKIEEIRENFEKELHTAEDIIQIFPFIFQLGIIIKARQIHDKAKKITDFYFEETWDNLRPSITAAYDLKFSELEYEMEGFGEKIDNLENGFSELENLYRQKILGQSIILLVSAFETFLSSAYITILQMKNVKGSFDTQESRSFQNWNKAVYLYNQVLGIKLLDAGIDYEIISDMIQQRHLLVHNIGKMDEKYIEKKRIQRDLIGSPLSFEEKSILNYIHSLKAIADFVINKTK